MVELVDRQICFRLADAVPAASPPGPFRLGDTQAKALSELLQVFACGEESAALAFAHLVDSPLEDAARRGLARVVEEELIHERLLRRLRAALPPPAPDRELHRALRRFYHGIAQADIGLHLASIAALDSAVSRGPRRAPEGAKAGRSSATRCGRWRSLPLPPLPSPSPSIVAVSTLLGIAVLSPPV